MSEGEQLLTPEMIMLILLLAITVGMWLQLALLRTRLSSRLTRLEERLHEHDQLLELQSKGPARSPRRATASSMPPTTASRLSRRCAGMLSGLPMMCVARSA